MPCITDLEPKQSVEQLEFEFKTHEIRIDTTFDPMFVCGVLFIFPSVCSTDYGDKTTFIYWY